MTVTLRQLRYLEALARHLHFGRAAEECAVSQPALSQQVQDMEALLGVKLVERGPRRVALTPRGEEVARRAAAILGSVRDLVDYARHHGALLAGPLRLGVIPSVAPYLLPRALPLVEARFPALELHLRETLTETLEDELAQGLLDAILIALPVHAPGFEALPLFVDRFLLAARAGSAETDEPFARPERIPPERLLLLEEGHCLRDQTLAYCRIARPETNGFGAASLSTIMQMVAGGYGVTLLPELSLPVEARDPRIALRRFAAPEPSREIALVWRRSSPRRADFDALGALLREAAERTGHLAPPNSLSSDSVPPP